MKNIKFSAAFIVVIVAVLALPLVASASNQWGKYAWPVSGELTLGLGDNLDIGWDEYLTKANSDWNVSTVVANSVVPGAADNQTNCTPETGAVEICNSAYGENGWLGLAGIWITKGKQITRAYVKLNDTYFDTPFYNTADWRQMVTCQEVGHTFGLAHQDEDFDNANLNTCMDYTSNPASNTEPNQHDFDQLDAMYGGDDGGGGSGGGPPAGKGKPSGAPGNDISQWGKAISTDGNGRPNLFELDLGGGNKFFTHVLWAD